MPRSRSQASISLPVDFEQRPDQAFARYRQNPRKPGEPRAAQDAVQHGFGLIGASVAGGDAVHRSGCDQLGVKCLADIAGGLFQIAVDGGNVGVAKVERQPEICEPVRDEFGVGQRRRAANAVLDVDHAEP